MNTQQLQLPAHLAGRQRRGLAEIARTGLGRGVPYISIEGGAFTLIDENGQQRPVPTPYLDVAIIDVTPIVSRVFWGLSNGYGSEVKNYPGKGQAYSPPICFSDNGVGASAQAQDPQSTNCKGCRWSEWGSARSRLDGKGIPACGSTKKIAVYVPGIVFPFLLRIPIMSHDNFKHYLSLFVGQDFDVDQVWTRISFVHGVQGVLQFEATSKYDPNFLWVDEAASDTIDAILAHQMTDQLVGRGDAVWQGPVAEIAGLAPPPNPQPAPTASPGGFLPGGQQSGFGAPYEAGQPPVQSTQPAGSAAPAQPAGKPRGRPRKQTASDQQNPAAPGISAPGGAPSGFTSPPQAPAAAAPAPATTAPFGLQAGAAPTGEMTDVISRTFGLPLGGR